MRVGVPAEIKKDEYRVGLTPAGTRELTARGHEVVVERGAGEGSAITDAEGAKAPHVISRDQLSLMKKRTVLVDVSIDQGGSFEASRPTTHSDPTYEVDGILHYCVANMPGAVPVTSTRALTNATLPYVLELADRGPLETIGADPGIAAGVNVVDGQLTEQAVAKDQEAEWTPVGEALERIGACPSQNELMTQKGNHHGDV
jgi:alanine dehydrogenase